MSMLHVRRTRFLLGLFGAAVLFALVALTSTSTVGLLQDDAIYLSTARGLADGEGYRHVEMPARPWQTKYPPLYPAVLALGLLLGADGALLLLPTAFAGAALVGLSFLYWRHVLRAPPRFALLVGLAAIFSPALLAFARYFMSELLFAALAVAALLCLDLSERATRRWPLLVVAGVLTGLAVLTRSIGVTLAGAGLLTLLLRRRWREAAVFTGLVWLLVGPWILWQGWAADANGVLQTTGFTGPDLAYGLWRPEGPGDVLRTVQQNLVQAPFDLAYYQLAFPPIIAGQGFSAPGWQRIAVHAAAYVAGISCLVGFVASVRRGWQSVHVYALAYGALILAWPFDLIRFLVPWSPFLLYFVFCGVRVGARRAFGWRGVKRTLLLAFVLLVVNFHHDLAKIHLSDREWVFCREFVVDFTDLDAVADYTRARLPEDAVIAGHHFGALYLATGRRGYPPWPAGNPYDVFVGEGRSLATFYKLPGPNEAQALQADVRARFAELYGEAGVTHYVEWANGHETAALRALREEHPEWFREVFLAPNKTLCVYEVRLR